MKISQSSVSQKLLGVIIDNKLDFTEHLNAECKNPNLKLYTLNRISRFLSPGKYLLIINAYIKSFFNYWQLVWMSCYWGIMHKMNKIHEQSLRLWLKNYKDDFQDSLRSSGDISIHRRCINSLLPEVYKYIHGLSPEIINDIFLPEQISIIQDSLMFSKLAYLPWADLNWIRYLTKPSSSEIYLLKTSNHVRH